MRCFRFFMPSHTHAFARTDVELHHAAVLYNGNSITPHEKEALPETHALAMDVSTVLDTEEPALLAFDMDAHNHLFLTDLCTSVDHRGILVDDEIVPPQRRVRLHPGSRIDLNVSGAPRGQNLAFTVTRDEHAHA